MDKVRNLVIGCDGTWNDTEEVAKTNVFKLLDNCLSQNHETHYEEGVGTAHWEALPGGIYGKGLDRQILGGYRFLRRMYADPNWAVDENKVFIFGFSRGSYAARRLAGLISLCGIPKKAADVQIAWDMYLNGDVNSIQALKDGGRLFDISIEMLGVWDTVKTTLDADFNDNKLPKCVVAGYHAMAIDEKRKFFPVLKWNSNARVTQTWFCGVHSDVGGGYKKTGLSDITLEWMVTHAFSHGLRVKRSMMNKLKKDPAGVMHDSFQGIWKPFGTSVRSIAKTAVVHSSVKKRLQKVTAYQPKNLPNNPNYET